MVVSTPAAPPGDATADAIDAVFHALADSTRRDILARTLEREHSVTELAEAYPVSFAAVQKHVAVLERAQLVAKRPDHRHRWVRARPETLRTVGAVLDELESTWRGRVERFREALAEDTLIDPTEEEQ